MNDKFFIDTNILIYFYTKTEKEKLEVLEKLLCKVDLVISTQVLNEFSNVLLKKFNLSIDEIATLLKEICQWCFVHTVELPTIIRALSITKRYKVSYFDALMLAAALECNCENIYSEDMHHNCLIEESLRIVNPFKIED